LSKCNNNEYWNNNDYNHNQNRAYDDHLSDFSDKEYPGCREKQNRHNNNINYEEKETSGSSTNLVCSFLIQF